MRAQWVCSRAENSACLLYTSDAADENGRVDLGGRRIIKKKNAKKLIINVESLASAVSLLESGE